MTWLSGPVTGGSTLTATLTTRRWSTRSDVSSTTSSSRPPTPGRLRPVVGLATLTDSTAAAPKTALRSLAKRHQHLGEEIVELDAGLLPLVQARCRGCSRTCAAERRSQPAAGAPTATGSTAAVIAPRTTPCTPSSCPACATTRARSSTRPGTRNTDSARKRSSALGTREIACRWRGTP